MSNILTSRDGLIGNSPRYAGYLSPPYQKYLKDDSGAAINLTGVLSGALGMYMVNQSNPLLVKTGAGIFSIPSATAPQGLISYQYAPSDLATPGNWYLFVTVKIPGEIGQRAFDPDFLSIIMPAGGIPIVTIQQVDLEQLLGTPISSSNPVPISGPINAADGAITALGATTDASTASTVTGLLKAIKAYLSGTLTTTTTEANSASILAGVGTPADAAWSGSGSGSEIAILKKLVAELAATLSVSVTNFPSVQTVTGSVTTSGTVTEANSSSINTHLANIDTDSATVVTNTGRIPTSPAQEGGNLATIATNTGHIPVQGAATTSASTPVNIASDQTVPIKRSAVAVYSLASTTTSGTTQNSGDLTVGPYAEIALDINTTAQAGTNPTIQYFYERKATDGIYYVLWQSAVLTAATNTISTSIGAGMAYNQSLGATGRLRWVVGGTGTPTFTHTLNIQGK